MAIPTHGLAAIEVRADPAKWSTWGFDVQEVGGHFGVWLGGTWLWLAEGAPRAGVQGWRIIGAPDLWGLPVCDPAPNSGSEKRAHPNGVDGIDHVVVYHPNLGLAKTTLASAGIEVRRWREIASRSARQGFAWLGDVVLELVGPSEPVPGKVRYLGVALNSHDLVATAAAFGEASSTRRAAVQQGRQIITIDTAADERPRWLAIMSPHVPTKN